ncbi:MAG TPA: LCP family protein [Clostridiales bacterium]|jgi:LCP family protein required for cell wall assembly|nr:LCP family protein [Clostridiales bacterium]
MEQNNKRTANEKNSPIKAGSKSRKKANSKTAKTVTTFLLVFVLATAALVPLRHLFAHVGDSTVFETEERLMDDMVPIVVDENSPFYEVFQSKDRVNFLLMGVSERMTDTLMLASYDMVNQYINMISIPRDTFYFRPGYSPYAANKINSIYNSQGVSAVAEAVSTILYGMPIHYYAIVEYSDIRKVMDVVGGVKVNIPFHMKYIDTTKGKELYIDIPAGEQTIDSSNVIEFLRFRKTNPAFARQGYKSYDAADIRRIQTQQEFVKAVLKECLKVGNLADVARVTLQNVESDLTYAMAGKLVLKAMSGLSSDNVSAYTLPGRDKMMHELSFWVADEEKIGEMLMEIYSLEAEAEDVEGENGEGGEVGSGSDAKPAQ